MDHIDLEIWPRRELFKVFKTWEYPQFSMCANVDATAFYPAVKQREISFTVAFVYLLARAANAIPEFRYRIRQRGVVEHEIVHPSITVLTDKDLFSFCSFEYEQDFSQFAVKAADRIAYMQEHPTVKNEKGQDNLLFMTAIPWVAFTSFMHPLKLNPADSVPRFAWGKFFEQGNSLMMPLSVQGHHALMDGVHVGRYYEQVQSYLNSPKDVLGD